MFWSLKNVFSGESLTIQNTFNIGRDLNADLVCRTSLISRNHAKLSIVDGKLWLSDKGSSNGTYINDDRIEPNVPVELYGNDEIGFGMFRKRNDLADHPDFHYIYTVIKEYETIEIDSDSDNESRIKTIKTENLEPAREVKIEDDEISKEIRTIDLEEEDEVPTVQALIQSESNSSKIKNVALPLTCGNNPIQNTNVQNQPSVCRPKSPEYIHKQPSISETKAATYNDVKEEPLDERIQSTEPILIENERATCATKSSEQKFVQGPTDLFRKNIPSQCNVGEQFSTSVNNKTILEAQPSTSVTAPQQDEMQIKTEVRESISSYTEDDSIIVINDDDEEDFGFMCSQLYVQNEPQPGNSNTNETISHSQYLDIKKELEELDAIDYAKLPAIPIDDWSSDGEPWDADDNVTAQAPLKLASMLTDNGDNGLPDEPITSFYDDIEQKVPEVFENTVKDDENDQTTPTYQPAEKDDSKIAKSSNASSSKKTVMIDPLPAKVNKRSEPVSNKALPVPKTVSKPTTSTSSNNIRKNVFKKPDSKVIRKNKKKYTAKPTNGIWLGSHANSNYNSKQLIEDRKKRLKELAEKDVSSTNDDKVAKKPSTNTNRKCQIKVSEGRGGFLLADVKPANSVDKKRKNQPHNANSTTNKKRKFQINDEAATNRVLDSILEDIDKEALERKQAKKIVKVTTKPSNQEKKKYNPLPKENPVTLSPNSNYNNYTVRGNGGGNRPTPKQLANRIIVEHMDAILTVIHWKCQWLDEQKKQSDPPSQISHGVIKMCDAFSSYKNYFNTLQPLIKLEFWNNLFKEYCGTEFKEQSDNFIGTVIHIENHDKLVELTCCTYVKTHEKYLRDKNLVMLGLQYENMKHFKKTFGVVTSVTKESLKNNDIEEMQRLQGKKSVDYKCHMKLTITVVIAPRKERLKLRSRFVGRYFTSFGLFIRISASLKNIENSKLLNHILAPTTKTYCLPYILDRDLSYKNTLNATQKSAVIEANYICTHHDPGIYLIEGPPGTGKSRVIVNMILDLLLAPNSKTCILLLAPTNGAIDNLVDKLANVVRPKLDEANRKKLRIVRIGIRQSVAPSVYRITLDDLVLTNLRHNFFIAHPSAKLDYDNLVNDVADLKKTINISNEARMKYKEKCRKLENFFKDSMKFRYQAVYDKQRYDILNRANLICSTIGSCSKLIASQYNTNNITCCIIDESTQCSEAETLIPISFGINRIVLVGDPQQLPAITSKIAKEYGYDKSFFARIKTNLSRNPSVPCIKLLTEQYRMHPEICQFPNKAYYNQVLRNIFEERLELQALQPYLVFNQCNLSAKSYCNEYEVNYVILLIEAILNILKMSSDLSIGIITPYNDQRVCIEKKLRDLELTPNVFISCNTVDSFQGQEKDIIILSCVRNCPNSFLADEHRLNVSLTRAKHALYIIGSKSLFESCRVLRKIKCDAERRHLYCNSLIEVKQSSIFENLIKRK